MDRPRIAIVGAGLAGLSAAEALLRHHGSEIDIDLYEAKRSTGGRAGSFQDPHNGETVDYCQHVAMGCCTNLIALLQRCGLSADWDRYSELEFRFAGYRPSQFAPSARLPAPLHLAKAFGAIKYLTPRQKIRIATGIWRLIRTPTKQLASETALHWLSRQGQDAVCRERFWDVILVSALGESTQKVSMAAARKVLVDGFLSARGAPDVWVPAKPLSDLFGVRLTTGLQDLGATVHTGRLVDRLHRREDGRVDPIVAGAPGDTADHVIVATPWHQCGDLLANHLPHELTRSYRSIPASPITGVHLWFDREFTDRSHCVLVGSVSHWLFRRRDSQSDDRRKDSSQPRESNDRGVYYQVVISASSEARAIPNDMLVERVLSELKQFFPAAGDATLLRSRVVTDPRSVFSVRPEIEQIRPNTSTALPWLHLAGDWIDTGWPATMEGAVISGRLAANSVSLQLKRGTIPIDAGLPRGWLAGQLIKP